MRCHVRRLCLVLAVCVGWGGVLNLPHTTNTQAQSPAQQVHTNRRVPAPTDPSVTIPATLTAHPGRMLQISATTTGKTIKWVCASQDADCIAIRDDGSKAIFASPTAGVYLVFAWTALGDVPSDASVCVITVGTPPPPNPIPPGPTPPNPTPPNPVDPLTVSLQTAFAAEADPSKVAQVGIYAALFRNAATTTVPDITLKTTGDLKGVLVTARKALLPDTAIPKIRRVVADEMDTVLGTDPNTALDAATRSKCAAEFNHIATALGGLK